MPQHPSDRAQPPRGALLVGAAPLGDAELPGVDTDLAGWATLLRGLRVARPLTLGVEAPVSAAAVLAAAATVEGDELWVFWSGHGEASPEGLQLCMADGERLPLTALTAAAGERPLRLMLDCCGAEGHVALEGDVIALHSVGLNGQAQRVRVEGAWRGLLSWSAQRVIEQWTTEGEGVALSWVDLATRTSALMATLTGRSLAARAVGPALHRPLGDAPPAVGSTAPRLAAQVDHDITLIFDRTNGADLGTAFGQSDIKLKWGWNVSSASALPTTMVMKVQTAAAPGTYTYTFFSGNSDFSTTTSGPSTTGGRLYKANVADLWVKIRNDTQRVSFYVGSTLLSGGRLIQGTWTLSDQTNAPSTPPTGGWYVCVDELT